MALTIVQNLYGAAFLFDPRQKGVGREYPTRGAIPTAYQLTDRTSRWTSLSLCQASWRSL